MNTAFTLPAKQIQTNSNNTVPIFDWNNLDKKIEEYVEFRLNNTLLYRVQCVNCEEAGVLLSVDTDTVREWIKAGKLTASKIGREWTIRVADIDKMLSSTANVIRLDDKRFKRNRKAN